MNRKVFLASDHGGFKLKEKLKAWMQEQGTYVVDGGTNSELSIDYPPLAKNAANAILKDEVQFAVLICGSGIGMAIAANRVKGIRASVINDPKIAKLTREHNNANVLCLGGRLTSFYKAKKIVKAFLTTEFSSDEPRYIKRNCMLDE